MIILVFTLYWLWLLLSCSEFNITNIVNVTRVTCCIYDRRLSLRISFGGYSDEYYSNDDDQDDAGRQL